MISFEGISLLGNQSWLAQTMYTLLTFLDWLVYSLLSKTFELFMIVARIDIFGSSPEMNEIYGGFVNRVYTVLWIVMIFVVAYFLLMKIVNPDGDVQGLNSKKLVPDILFSVIGVIIFPTLMGYLMTFQNHVLADNTIARIIFDVTFEGNESTNKLVNGEQGGTIAGVLIYTSLAYPESGVKFNDLIKQKYNDSNDELEVTIKGSYWDAGTMIHIDLGFLGSIGNGGSMQTGEITFKVPPHSSYYDIIDENQMPASCNQACKNYVATMVAWYNTGDPGVLKNGMFKSYLNEPDGIHYWVLFTLAAGGWACWCLIAYAFDVAKRCIKLAFLQVIAPIAFGLRLVPPGRQQFYPIWSRELTKTYLQVFMQMFFLYFTIYLVSLVPNVLGAFFNAADNAGYSGTTRFFAQVFLIIGLLAFLREAPSLLKNLFPTDGLNMGGVNLMPNKAWSGSAGQARRTVGQAAGATAGLVGHGIAVRKNLEALNAANNRHGLGRVLNVGTAARQYLRGARSAMSAGMRNESINPRNVAGAMQEAMRQTQDNMQRTIEERSDRQSRLQRANGNYAAFAKEELARATGFDQLRDTYNSLGPGERNSRETGRTAAGVNTATQSTTDLRNQVGSQITSERDANLAAVRSGTLPTNVAQNDIVNAAEGTAGYAIKEEAAIQMATNAHTITGYTNANSDAVYNTRAEWAAANATDMQNMFNTTAEKAIDEATGGRAGYYDSASGQVFAEAEQFKGTAAFNSGLEAQFKGRGTVGYEVGGQTYYSQEDFKQSKDFKDAFNKNVENELKDPNRTIGYEYDGRICANEQDFVNAYQGELQSKYEAELLKRANAGAPVTSDSERAAIKSQIETQLHQDYGRNFQQLSAIAENYATKHHLDKDDVMGEVWKEISKNVNLDQAEIEKTTLSQFKANERKVDDLVANGATAGLTKDQVLEKMLNSSTEKEQIVQDVLDASSMSAKDIVSKVSAAGGDVTAAINTLLDGTPEVDRASVTSSVNAQIDQVYSVDAKEYIKIVSDNGGDVDQARKHAAKEQMARIDSGDQAAFKEMSETIARHQRDAVTELLKDKANHDVAQRVITTLQGDQRQLNQVMNDRRQAAYRMDNQMFDFRNLNNNMQKAARDFVQTIMDSNTAMARDFATRFGSNPNMEDCQQIVREYAGHMSNASDWRSMSSNDRVENEILYSGFQSFFEKMARAYPYTPAAPAQNNGGNNNGNNGGNNGGQNGH